MRKIIAPAALAVAALGVGGASATGLEGCVAQGIETPYLYGYNPTPKAYCSDDFTASASIAGKGEWRVEVFASGECGVGAPEVFSGVSSDLVLLEDAIPAGSCAAAEAGNAESVVAIGGVSAVY